MTLDTDNLIGDALAITAILALDLASVRMIQTETHLIIVYTWMPLRLVGILTVRRGTDPNMSAQQSPT